LLRRPSPVLLGLGGWMAAASFALALRYPGLWSLGLVLLVASGWAARRAAATHRRPEEKSSRGCDAAAWLGVGSLPVVFASIALGSARLGDWLLGPLSIVLFAIAVGFGIALLDDGAREAVARDDGLSFGPFINAIASRQPAPTDARKIANRRARQERIIAVETLLMIVAYAIVSFAGLLAFLTRHRWGVHVTGQTSNATARRDAATTYVLWHAADLVPGLDIPHTVHWKLRHDFTDHYSGGLLLALKLFIAIPVLRTVATLWRHT